DFGCESCLCGNKAPHHDRSCRSRPQRELRAQDCPLQSGREREEGGFHLGRQLSTPVQLFLVHGHFRVTTGNRPVAWHWSSSSQREPYKGFFIFFHQRYGPQPARDAAPENPRSHRNCTIRPEGGGGGRKKGGK